MIIGFDVTNGSGAQLREAARKEPICRSYYARSARRPVAASKAGVHCEPYWGCFMK
jgi:hypothetical protein